MKVRNTFFTLLIALAMIACGSPSDSGSGGGNGGDGGNGGSGSGGSDTPDDTTPPSAPGGIDGESGDEIIELSWSANSEDDLEGYNLYRSRESFSSNSSMDPVNGSDLLTETGYSDQEVENGTTYYYRLTAIDDSGNESSLSSQVKVTPFSDPPGRPKNQ